MTAKKRPELGSTIDLASDGHATVIRPDGVEVTVSGGLYVLSQPGTYVIDGQEVEVK